MKDMIFKNGLPLKIVHQFPKSDGGSIDEWKAQIDEKLDQLVALGFGGVVTNCRFSDTDYLQNSEDWELFVYSLDQLQKRGLRAWIYDENGYPSGGAGGLTLAENPDFECRAIAKVPISIEKGTTAVLELPKGHKRFLYAATYVCDEKGVPTSFEPVEEFVCDGTEASLTFKNDTDDALTAYAFVEKHLYEGTHAQHNVFESRKYLDVTNPDAVREFIRNTYEKYTKYASKHYISPIGDDLVEAFFTDEPSFMGCYINGNLYPPKVRDKYDDSIPLYPIVNFGRDVENTFEALSGLNFRKNLIYLFYGDSKYAKNVRYFFHKTTSYLFEKNFYAQISDYCAAHNARFSGHLLLEDDIRHHVIFEGNFFSLMRHMHFPGIDMLHSLPELVRRDMFTPKLISSIAHAYNRPHVMSEVSAHAQGGKATGAQMYASVALQYAYGVDIFTSYYSEAFCEPAEYKRINNAIGNIVDTMKGTHCADVLLCYPIETFMFNHKTPDHWSYGNFTPEENACKNGLYNIMYELCDAQVDFDFADMEVIKNLAVKNGRLLGKSGEEYKYLVLPPMEITPEMCGIFTHLEKNGVKICIMRDTCFPELNSVDFGTKFSTAAALVTSFDRAEEDFAIDLDAPHRSVVCLCKESEGKKRYLFINAEDNVKKISCTLNDLEKIEIYNPLTQTSTPIASEQNKSGTKIEFELGGYGVVIIK